MRLSQVKKNERLRKVRIALLIAAVAAGVLAIILFVFPLIEDLARGVDPTLRYQPKVEANFTQPDAEPTKEELKINEIYLSDRSENGQNIMMKNEPYIDGNRIIFTTQIATGAARSLDGVVIYDTQTEEATILPNVQKAFDDLRTPVISGNIAVWVDSASAGGGRIVGYNLETNEQFTIKDYAYAAPRLAINGDTLAFMQWAGDKTQRLYVYNVNTREAATVKLYENVVGNGNSDVDISASDMVWAERDAKKDPVESVLKRIVFENGVGKYDNYDLGKTVYGPKTNGKVIVFATTEDVLSGSLMLSVAGGEPVKITDNALNYDIGDNFVVYTKADGLYITYTDMQGTEQITSDISRNLLASANGTGICFYDTTDNADVLDEVVKYTYIE